jgi:hypothetical protein
MREATPDAVLIVHPDGATEALVWPPVAAGMSGGAYCCSREDADRIALAAAADGVPVRFVRPLEGDWRPAAERGSA